MRKSKQEAAETRERIVEAASREFRRNGIEGTGLVDLMAAARLTHGGFYKHFESKEQVVEEALALAMNSMAESWNYKLGAGPGNRGLHAAMIDYLSKSHCSNPADGCPFAALGSEIARGSDSARETTTKGFVQLVDLIASHLDGVPPAAAKRQALLMLITMIGAVTMARVVTDPDLSALILREARKHLT